MSCLRSCFEKYTLTTGLKSQVWPYDTDFSNISRLILNSKTQSQEIQEPQKAQDHMLAECRAALVCTAPTNKGRALKTCAFWCLTSAHQKNVVDVYRYIFFPIKFWWFCYRKQYSSMHTSYIVFYKSTIMTHILLLRASNYHWMKPNDICTLSTWLKKYHQITIVVIFLCFQYS